MKIYNIYNIYTLLIIRVWFGWAAEGQKGGVAQGTGPGGAGNEGLCLSRVFSGDDPVRRGRRTSQTGSWTSGRSAQNVCKIKFVTN